MTLNGFPIERKKLADLVKAEYNPRQISEQQKAALQKSLKEFGTVEPIVWNKRSLNVVGGHQRLDALLALGETETDVVIVDLPKNKEKALNVALNQISGTWQEDKLADLLNELKLEDFDLSLTGFDDKEIQRLIDSLGGQEGLTDDDAIPEVKESVCKTGELWQLGEHRLLCGDSTDSGSVAILMNGQKADMVFTDPPYGIDYSGGRTQVVAKKDYGKIQGDVEKDISPFIKTILDIAENKDFYICLSPINLKFAFDVIPKYEGIIVWKKPSPGLGYQWIRRYCEFIIFGTQRKKAKADNSEFDFWDIQTDPRNEYQHGTQKPVALSERAIAFSSVAKDVVCDPFLGSGSTLIACEKTSRKCYGIEIDTHYCDVIIKRWEDFTGNKAVCLT